MTFAFCLMLANWGLVDLVELPGGLGIWGLLHGSSLEELAGHLQCWILLERTRIKSLNRNIPGKPRVVLSLWSWPTQVTWFDYITQSGGGAETMAHLRVISH